MLPIPLSHMVFILLSHIFFTEVGIFESFYALPSFRPVWTRRVVRRRARASVVLNLPLCGQEPKYARYPSRVHWKMSRKNSQTKTFRTLPTLSSSLS